MTRPDNLGTLPFSDYADPDPDALPFGDEAQSDGWRADEMTARIGLPMPERAR